MSRYDDIINKCWSFAAPANDINIGHHGHVLYLYIILQILFYNIQYSITDHDHNHDHNDIDINQLLGYGSQLYLYKDVQLLCYSTR